MNGYAVKNDGSCSFRAVTSDMALAGDETFSATMPEPTAEQQRADKLDALERVVDAYMDSVAKQKRYASRLSICTYKDSVNPTYAAEAAAFMAWRDLQLLPTCYAIMDAVDAGEREIPTPDELIAELPGITWPE